MKENAVRLDVPDESVVIYPENGFWTMRLSFRTSYNATSNWFPTLDMAKREAGADYKWHLKQRRRPTPKRLKWIEEKATP